MHALDSSLVLARGHCAPQREEIVSLHPPQGLPSQRGLPDLFTEPSAAASASSCSCSAHSARSPAPPRTTRCAHFLIQCAPMTSLPMARRDKRRDRDLAQDAENQCEAHPSVTLRCAKAGRSERGRGERPPYAWCRRFSPLPRDTRIRPARATTVHPTGAPRGRAAVSRRVY